MDTFLASSFGPFVMVLCQDLFTAPSWQSVSLLACGGTLAVGRHPITTSLWLTGAARVQHFSRFSVFLGGPLSQARWKLWAHLIHHAAHWVPNDAPIVIEVDDSTKKKAGAHSEGVDRYRNGAGSARQEYRPRRGGNFVWAIMRVPLPRWPGHCLSVPLGVSLDRKDALAPKRPVPDRSRSVLAREIIDFVAAELPGRHIRVLADGGYATKEVLRGLPPSVDVVSRRLITGKLYELPKTSPGSRRGRPPQQGTLLGSPKTFARTRQGWQPHPSEAGAPVQAWEGFWHPVLPGRRLRVVVRRPATKRAKKPGQRQAPPPVEALFTTDLSLSRAALLDHYRDRWAVDIALRDANACDGLGQDQCRKWQRIVGANTCRLVMAAARTRWFMEHASQADGLDLRRYRPWYRQKCAPSQLDIVWACREALHEAGVFPIPRFIPDLTENHEEPEHALPLAA